MTTLQASKSLMKLQPLQGDCTDLLKDKDRTQSFEDFMTSTYPSVDVSKKIEGEHPLKLCFEMFPRFFRDKLQIVNEEYVPPLDMSKKTHFVLSAQNTGKTFQMIKFAKTALDVGDVKYVFFVVSRRSLAERILGGLENESLGPVTIGDYRSFSSRHFEQIDKSKKRGAVICIDSLSSFFLHHQEGDDKDKDKDKNTVTCIDDQYTIMKFMTRRLKLRTSMCARVFKSRDRLMKIFKNSMFVFDEIRSLIEYVMTSDTLKGHQNIERALLFFAVKHAKKVVVMDSSLGHETVDFMVSLRGVDDSVFLWNVRDPPKKTVVFQPSSNKPYMMAQIIVFLRAGKNIFVTSDSKTFVDELARLIRQHVSSAKLIVYTSETADSERTGLAYPNVSWSQTTCVICSPTITYGVDHTVVHFYAQFHFYHGKTQTPWESFQQMGRTRIVETKVYVCMDLVMFQKDNLEDVVTQIDTKLHHFYTCGVRRLNSEFDQFYMAEMSDMSRFYLDNGTDESQSPDRMVPSSGEILMGELTYRLFFYANCSRFCQALRMESIIRDLSLYFGYDIIVGEEVVLGENMNDLLMVMMESIKNLSRSKRPHSAAINLVHMTDEEKKMLNSENHVCAMKQRCTRSQATQQDRKLFAMRTFMDNIGLKNVDGLSEDQISCGLRMKSSFNPEYLDNFMKVLLSAPFTYKNIIKEQDKEYFMKKVHTAMSVEVMQTMISWFFSCPLVFGKGGEFILIPKTELDKPCPRIINDVLHRMMQDHVLQHGFKFTKAMRSEWKPKDGVWTKKQAIRIFQACMRKFLNISVYLHLRQGGPIHDPTMYVVKVNIGHRDTLLELMYCRLMNKPFIGEKRDPDVAKYIEIMEETFDYARPTFKYARNTLISTYPRQDSDHRGYVGSRDCPSYKPPILDDDEGSTPLDDGMCFFQKRVCECLARTPQTRD
jgi:hypothetical protein